MELYQLKTFISVAETGNLTRSARECHLSPSTVSAQIKSLEQDFGIPLFNRTPKGMQLTPNGRDLLDHARTVTEAAARLSRRAEQMRKTRVKSLRIGMNTDPGFLDLPGIRTLVAKTLPNTVLSFSETQTFETVPLLRRGIIDLGFHFGRFDHPGILSVPLNRVQVRVVLPERLAAAHETASLEKLMGLPWIWTRQDCPYHTEFRRVMDWKGDVPVLVADAVDETVVGELVKSGTGAALMRHDLALALVNQHRARFWQGPPLEIDFCIACREDRKSEQAIAGFLSAIREKFVKMS